MAFPVVVFNSSTGSNTQASGAGPATAVFGTAASFAGSVATLDGSPDLSGVATDGSAVLWLQTSTGRQYFTINAKDNTAKTVTLDDAPAGTASGLTWAIGGKRSTLDAATSRTLFATTGYKAGWTIELNSGTYSLTSQLDFGVAGSSTNIVTIKGTAGTKPVITSATSGLDLWDPGGRNYLHFKNLKFTHTGAARGDAIAATAAAVTNCVFEDIEIDGCKDGFGGDYITDFTFINCTFIDVEIYNCTGTGFTIPGGGNIFLGCFVHDNAGNGLWGNEGGGAHHKHTNWTLINCVIVDNGGRGVYWQSNVSAERAVQIIGCTIANNASDGVELVCPTTLLRVLYLFNSIIYGNGGWGVRVDFGFIAGVVGGYNAYGDNTSGDRDGYTALPGEVALSADPFVSASDYALNNTSGGGASCRAAAFPGTMGAQISHAAIGALQPATTATSDNLIEFPNKMGTYIGMPFPGITSVLANAVNEGIAYLGNLYLTSGPGTSKTISAAGGGKIYFLCQATVVFANASTTWRIGIQDVASGLGDGSWDVYKDYIGGTDTINNGTVTVATMASGTKTITHGDLIAIVGLLTTFGGADSLRPQVSSLVNGGSNYPCIANNNTSRTNAAPSVLIEFDDGTFGFFGESMLPVAVSNVSYGSSSTPDEYGLIFQVPFPCTINRLVAQIGDIDAGDTGELILYSDPLGTPVAEETFTLDYSGEAGITAYQTVVPIPEFELQPNTNYCIAYRPTSTNVRVLGRHVLPVAGSRACLPLGTTMLGASRSDQTGPFSTDSTTLPVIGFYANKLGDGSSVGGGGGGGTLSAVF